MELDASDADNNARATPEVRVHSAAHAGVVVVIRGVPYQIKTSQRRCRIYWVAETGTVFSGPLLRR